MVEIIGSIFGYSAKRKLLPKRYIQNWVGYCEQVQCSRDKRILTVCELQNYPELNIECLTVASFLPLKRPEAPRVPKSPNKFEGGSFALIKKFSKNFHRKFDRKWAGN